MSVQLTPKQKKELYDSIYPEMKAKGLSDRDADIMTNAKMYPRSALCMAHKHGMTAEEVEEVYKNYYPE